MPQLIVTRAHQSRAVGDRIEVSEREARILIAINKAEPAPVELPVEPTAEKPAAKKVTTKDAAPYKRRDMSAE